MKIQRVIARYVQAGKFIYIAKHQVLLDMLRQVQRRSQVVLMARTRSVRNVRSWIQAVSVLAYVHLQETVGPHELPSRQNLPFGKRLDAVCSSTHLVARDKRKNHIIRHRTAGKDGCAGLRRSQICVIVVKGCKIQRERTGCLHAISDLISQKIFRSELTAPKNRLDHRQWAIQWRSAGRNNRFVQLETLLSKSRRSDRPRYGSPDGLVFCERSQNSDVRFKFEARERVVLEFRTNRNVHAVVEQAHLVLHECAVLIQVAVVWKKRDRKAGAVSIPYRTIAQTPNQFLRFAKMNIVLKIDVVDGFMIPKNRGVRDIGSVIVHLQ